MSNQYLHEVVITAIIIKDGKYLITQRSPDKKRFPLMWTVPGGRLEPKDYLQLEKQTKDYWYNVLEQTLAREVKEEVGLEIDNVEYLTSLATIHADGSPSLVISCTADYVSGEIVLQEGEAVDSVWVSTEQARNYDLIDGILDEFIMIDKKLAGEKVKWERAER